MVCDDDEKKEMIVRSYEDSDYDLLRKWWAKYDQGIPTREMLPPTTTLVAEKDNRVVAALTMYTTNSKQFAMIDNLIADPESSKEDRRLAIRRMLLIFKFTAKAMGIKSFFCCSTKEKLTERYEEYGFKPTCRGVTTMSKNLGEI